MKIYLKIFLPFILSLFFIDAPEISYVIAWLGSFYVFYVTWIQFGKKSSDGLPIENRIMRPMFIMQAIFAGYMCITSIFYFYDIYEQYQNFKNNLPELFLSAKSQRLCLLGHIAFVLGIRANNDSAKNSNYTSLDNSSSFYLKLAVISLSISYFFSLVSALSQFGVYFGNLYTFAITFTLVKGVKERKNHLVIIGIIGFFINLALSSLTGMKEPIIVHTIILSVMFYPIYKRTVIAIAVPILLVLFYFLPTYAKIIRQESWFKGTDIKEARSLAFEQIFDGENEEDIKDTNWKFLTGRLSEMEMFNKFIDFVPTRRDYYEFDILNNSFTALIPRAIWPSKQNTEEVSMQRVYEAGVIERGSSVSAKTRPIIDGYLSYGFLGGFVFIFFYGFFAQWACNRAEHYFGSYELGCIVMFNSFFQALWRGNNFEFILNNMIYGLFTMWLVFLVLRKMQILVPKSTRILSKK